MKKIITIWNKIFNLHPIIEAFLLSAMFHFLIIVFLWFCFEIHSRIFPQKERPHIIEIEFTK